MKPKVKMQIKNMDTGFEFNAQMEIDREAELKKQELEERLKILKNTQGVFMKTKMTLAIILFVVAFPVLAVIDDQEFEPPTTLPYDRSVYGFPLTDGFYAPRAGGKLHHGAWDIAVPAGTAVYSPLEGVAKVKDDGDGLGLYILIEQQKNNLGGVIAGPWGFGVGHLSEPQVLSGWEIKRGQLIGFSGASGCARGAHIHFWITYKGRKINPADVIEGMKKRK